MKRKAALHILPPAEQRKIKIDWTKLKKPGEQTEEGGVIIPIVLQDAQYKINLEPKEHEPICQCVLCVFKRSAAYRETKTEKKPFIVEGTPNVRSKKVATARKRT